MKSVFQQMREHQKNARGEGQDIQLWQILTDVYPGVEDEAIEAGAFSADDKTILGAPFEVSDRVQTDLGYLAMTTRPGLANE